MCIYIIHENMLALQNGELYHYNNVKQNFFHTNMRFCYTYLQLMVI